MGCSPSSVYVHPLRRSGVWRMVTSSEEARRKYLQDGSLPVGAVESMLELREMLDKNFLIEYVSMFESNKSAFMAYSCWEDVRELKGLTAVGCEFKHSKVVAVYQRYLKTGAKHFLQGVPGHVVVEIRAACKVGKLESLAVLDPLQQHCLSVMHREVFLSFRKSKKYEDFLRTLRHQYNQVHPNDFVYYRVIGEGTYGVVVHAQKLSTGQHYAIKMLTKTALLEVFRSAPHRVDHEKQALASCCHPFVVSLGYAFQTSSMVFLATSLGRGGTLMDALRACPSHRMEEERVRFYGAEMVVALAHFHSLGMIFRDLKPDNVLLNADGHIQLVDLGGTVDPDGAVLSADAGIAEDGLFVRDFEGPSRSVRNASTASASASASASVVAAGGSAQGRALQRRGSDAEKSVSRSIRIHHVPSTTRQVLAVSRNGEREGEDEDGSVSHTRRTRARSIMGTEGFMAIEMRHLQQLKGVEKKCHSGYTNAVDWWSLGATLCFLLSGGFLPCQDTDIQAAMNAVEMDAVFRAGMRQIVEAADFSADRLPVDHRAIHDKLTSFPEVSMDAVKTIIQLLDFNEKTRLGATAAGGVRVVKQQRFFLPRIHASANDCLGLSSSVSASASARYPAGPTGVAGRSVPRTSSADKMYSRSSGGSRDYSGGVSADLAPAHCGLGGGKGSGKHMLGTGFASLDHFWDACEARQLEPPVLPDRSKREEHDPVPYRSFEHLMSKIGKEKWLQNPPPAHLNIYFRKWDFVSPQVVKMEFGIANVMQQYQSSAKARLLLGPVGEAPDSIKPRKGSAKFLWNAIFGNRSNKPAAETDNESSSTTLHMARSTKKK